MVLGNINEDVSKAVESIVNGMVLKKHRHIIEPKSARHLLWGYESEILSTFRKIRVMKDVMGKYIL